MTNVADHRDLGAFIPAVLDDYPLDPWEFRVYARIVRRAGGPRGHDESAANVAAAIGCGERKVREAYELLTLAGLVKRTKRPGRSDQYTLQPSARWADPARIDELRAEAKRPRRATEEQADGPVDNPVEEDDTAVQGTAVPGTGHRGPGDRGTAVPGTDEGSPRRFSQKVPPPPARERGLTAVHSEGGGGGDPWTAHLTAIAERLDDVDRARLAGETGNRLHRLTVLLHGLEHAGWGPDVCADALTRGSFADAGSVAAVLAHRAEQLRRGAAASPAVYRGPSAEIPKDVLAELDKRAVAAAFTDAGGIDQAVRLEVLDELAAAWLADQEPESA